MGMLKHVDFEVPGFGELASGPQITPAFHDAVLALNPLAYWRLGEASGTTALDLSGHGRHATYLPGVGQGFAGMVSFDSDSCADFPGGSSIGADHVTTPLPDGFLDNDWTILCSFVTDVAGVIRDVLGTAEDNTGRGIILRSGSAGSGIGVFSANNGSAATNLVLFSPIVIGTVYRVAITYQSSTGLISAYVNGVAATSGTRTGGFAAGKPFNLGEVYANGVSTSSTRSRRWNGRIDEVAVFPARLTAGDIATLHRLAIGGLKAS